MVVVETLRCAQCDKLVVLLSENHFTIVVAETLPFGKLSAGKLRDHQSRFEVPPGLIAPSQRQPLVVTEHEVIYNNLTTSHFGSS